MPKTARLVSTHAAHAGCDPFRQEVRRDEPVSIHAPLRGATLQRQGRESLLQVSTHAAHAGCDCQMLCLARAPFYMLWSDGFCYLEFYRTASTTSYFSGANLLRKA